MAEHISDGDLIEKAIKQGIEKEVSRAFDEHKKGLLEELDRDKDKIVAGIVLHVMGYVELHRSVHNVVVTIKKITE